MTVAAGRRAVRSSTAPVWVTLMGGALGGALTSLAFAPFGVAFCAVVGPAVGLAAMRSARRLGSAALASLLYGLAFTFLAFRWMLELDPIAYVVLCLLQAVFWVPTGAATRWLTRLKPGWWVAGTAAVWTLVELVRARFPVSGFEWGQLALAMSDTVFRRAAAMVGSVGLTGLLVATAAALVVAVAGRRRRTWRGSVPLVAAVLALVAVTGVGSVSWTTPGQVIQVALVQADKPCPGDFAQDCPGYGDELIASYLDSTARLPSTPDLIIWGEDALRGAATLDDVGAQFVASAGRLSAPLLAGTGTSAGPGRFYRWAALFDTDGTPLGGYAKRRPVPFGEYVPLRSVLGDISDVGRLVPSDLQPGQDASPLAVPVDGEIAMLGTVVSWEVTFSRLVRDVAKDAAGLVTLTTVSSYDTAAASDQLLAAAQLRAAEQQKPMAVAATTGQSALILANGEMTAKTALLQADQVIAEMPLRADLTPFGRTGDAPVALIAAMLLALAIVRVRHGSDTTSDGTEHRAATAAASVPRDRATDASAPR